MSAMRACARSVGFTRLVALFTILVLASLMALSLPAVAHATTYYVSVVGNDTATGLLGHPFATVQKAMSVAHATDIVSVGPGAFAGDVTLGDGVSLLGAGSLLTILHGSGSGPVITVTNAGAATAISGFTITGGGGSTGGGISCSYSSPAITDNTITGNASNYGGGIGCDHSSAAIIGNTIIDNTGGLAGGGIYCTMPSSALIRGNTLSGNGSPGGYGGGIYCGYCSPTIAGNVISGNYAGQGAGIYCYYQPSPTITNNVISANNATGQYGGGIACYHSSPTITNDTVTGNIIGGGGIYNDSGFPAITNCILWQNIDYDLWGCAATYSDVGHGGGGGTGVISADPGFVSAETGDYRLAAGSPCIDVAAPSGAPATDRNGIARPWGGGFDMGAYEYFAPTASTTTKLSAPSSVKVKRSLKLTGTVSPWSPPGKVTIAKSRLVGKKWKTVGTAKVSIVVGTFTYSFRPTAKGRWRFVATYPRTVVGPTTYLPSKSGTKTVKVK